MSEMYMILIFSSLMILSMKSWLMMWFMMELNMLSMCLIMSKNMTYKNKKKNTILMYFLTQSMASMIFISSSVSVLPLKIKQIFMMLSILAKMGMWPSHSWYLKLVESTNNMKYTPLVFIMSWQKLLPCLMLGVMANNNTMTCLFFLMLINLSTPLWNLKKNMKLLSIFSVSSMNYNPWMISSSLINPILLLLFISLYSYSLKWAFSKMEKMKKNSSTAFNSYWMSFANMINISWIPPSPMFMLKLITLKNLMLSKFPMLIMIFMIFSSMYLMFFYLWVMMTNLSNQKKKNQWTTTPKYEKENSLIMLFISSLMMLML